jgi:hypothetical protein
MIVLVLVRVFEDALRSAGCQTRSVHTTVQVKGLVLGMILACRADNRGFPSLEVDLLLVFLRGNVLRWGDEVDILIT